VRRQVSKVPIGDFERFEILRNFGSSSGNSEDVSNIDQRQKVFVGTTGICSPLADDR
jgi:hypothetical protein